jgi:hypothetical protein
MKTTRSSLAEERSRTPTGTFSQGVTIAKVIRDAKIMKFMASYVIEIDCKGNVIHQYGNPPFETLLDCIVVLSPIQFQDTHIDQAVVLEIGLSRFVPYKATEIKADRPDKKKQRYVIPSRQHVGTLPWQAVKKILPTIWTAIQICVDAKMERWTKARFVQEAVSEKQPLGTKRFAVYESWVTIRVPKEYALIYTVLRLKDECNKLQPNKNYVAVAETTRLEFEFFRKLNPLSRGNYTDEVVEKSVTLERVAKWIRRKINVHGYTSRSIKALRKLLRKGDSKDLSLFDKVYRVFKLPKAPPDIFLDTHEPMLGNQRARLLAECPLNPFFVNKYEKRRTTQARDCFTIAITGGREHMERLDIRNTQNRILAKKIKEGCVVEHQEDFDIPF